MPSGATAGSADAPGPPPSWADVLDELEERMRRLEAAVQGIAGDVPAEWAPPAALGPVPAALRARAASLLARSREAEEIAAARLVRLRRPATAYPPLV